jgi:hypothetical protein
MEEEKSGAVGSPKSPQEKKPDSGMALVGYNIIALVFYTLLCKLIGGSGFILDAFFIFIHVLFCIAMAFDKKSWFWFLGAVLVLVIGFSTCVMVGNGAG